MIKQDNGYLTIALPKGRMSNESIEHLHKYQLTNLQEFTDDRKLIYVDEQNKVEFLLIRSKDVGTYVEQGGADLGIMGYDLLQEHNFDVYTLLSLPYGVCRLSIAHPQSKQSWRQKKTIRVATKYPQLASRYFFEHGYNIEIIELYGSIEIAPLSGLSDVIVDLVSTGQTLIANHLTEDEIILHSSARLIANPSSSVYKRERIYRLIDTLAQEDKNNKDNH